MTIPDSSQPPADRETVAFSLLDKKHQRKRLQELAVVFLRLGFIAFGGPAAHIALVDDEVVKRRGWLTREKLLDLIGVTNLIPGPNSTELVIHIGYEWGGWRGLFLAGSCFILPAMVMVWLLAMVYVRFQSLPELGWLLYGIKPVIIAIILQALWKLGRKAIKDVPTIIAAIVVTIFSFLQFNEIILLLVAGVGVMLYKNWRRGNQGNIGSWVVPIMGISAQMTDSTTTVANVSVVKVFLFFLKVGSVLYGSGYVLLAFLQRDLVENYQWLSSQELLDAIAIGQFTPGPIFTTATFVGYLIGGNLGAIAATVGIFLPAFLLVLIINPWVPRLRNSPWFSGFLDGVNAASLGLMVVVTLTLAQSALVDIMTVIVMIVAIVVVFRFKVNSAWLVVAGGLFGFLANFLK